MFDSKIEYCVNYGKRMSDSIYAAKMIAIVFVIAAHAVSGTGGIADRIFSFKKKFWRNCCFMGLLR